MPTEKSVFLSCRAEINLLRSIFADYEAGEIDADEFSKKATKVVAVLCELADSAEQFDIVCPVVEFGIFSTSFWRWYNWWNDNSRPKDGWSRYRDKPAFKLIITNR